MTIVLVTPNSREQLDQYLDADLPQIGAVNGVHEPPSGNVVEVPRVAGRACCSLPHEGGKVLVTRFAFPSIQADVVGRSSVEVRIKTPNPWGQEAAYNTNPLATRTQRQYKMNRHNVIILVIVVLPLLVITDFGLKRTNVGAIGPNRYRAHTPWPSFWLDCPQKHLRLPRSFSYHERSAG